ncbi:uncharacterized protein V1518DRAFT_410029 [Limtongia smithiae]|uniref:uncharacterized protein n=1 Tax=Limtongia smithiae TaxID=1125753 RepID=UPI0034CF5502
MSSGANHILRIGASKTRLTRLSASLQLRLSRQGLCKRNPVRQFPYVPEQEDERIAATGSAAAAYLTWLDYAQSVRRAAKIPVRRHHIHDSVYVLRKTLDQYDYKYIRAKNELDPSHLDYLRLLQVASGILVQGSQHQAAAQESIADTDKQSETSTKKRVGTIHTKLFQKLAANQTRILNESKECYCQYALVRGKFIHSHMGSLVAWRKARKLLKKQNDLSDTSESKQ